MKRKVTNLYLQTKPPKCWFEMLVPRSGCLSNWYLNMQTAKCSSCCISFCVVSPSVTHVKSYIAT